jgi:hypothetical protein
MMVGRASGATSYKLQLWMLAAMLAGLAGVGVGFAQAGVPGPDAPAVSRALTLDDVLEGLQANLHDYRQTVPDLYCNERVESTMQGRGTNLKTVTEATFRLRKRRLEDGTIVFDESRVLRKVDGRPVTADVEKLSGPAILSGVFSTGLDLISEEERGCYEYTLRAGAGSGAPEKQPSDPSATVNRVGDKRDAEKMVVEFKDLPRGERERACAPFESTYGYAVLDPASMHVVLLEKTTPDYGPIAGMKGEWTWTVEYGPVQLLGKTFWVPKRIRSMSMTKDHSYTWSFDGTYSEYHLFHAESRIVPAEP